VDPRPNWEAYNAWPGAYNSIGHISPVVDPTYAPSYDHSDGEYYYDTPGSKYIPFLADQRKQENAQAYEFVNNRLPHHSRYKNLVPFKNWGSDQFPDFLSGGSGLATPNTMPTRLTQSLQVLNGRRLARMIQEDYPEIYARYKYAILAAATCYQLPLPQNVMTWHREQLAKQSLPEQQVPGFKKIVRLENAFDFIFKAYGIDTADWSMDFNTGGALAMTDKYGIPGGYQGNNPALAGGMNEIWQIPEYDPKGKDCASLAKKSLEALSVPVDQHFGELEAANKPLINRCISCHVELEVAPRIPFDDPEALKVALRKDNSLLFKKIQYRLGTFPKFGDAMPPNGYVKPEQKQKVLEYIETLYYSDL
jgi:hypothetical protein